MNLSFLTVKFFNFLFEDKVMNIVLSVVFIETNNLNVFWPRIFRPKMYFLFKRSLTVVNEGSLLTVVNKESSLTVVNEGSFFKTVVFEIDSFLITLKNNFNNLDSFAKKIVFKKTMVFRTEKLSFKKNDRYSFIDSSKRVVRFF